VNVALSVRLVVLLLRLPLPHVFPLRCSGVSTLDARYLDLPP